MQAYRIIVTGVSRGLGKQLLELIIKNDPEFEIIGTTRTQSQQIQQKFHKMYPGRNIRIMKLDIYDSQSIQNFAEILNKQKYEFDCLINNAAYGCDYGTQIPSVQTADKTIKTNYLGTVLLTNKLLPLIKNNGRIINVSSKLGGLNYQNKQIQQKYDNENITAQWIQFEALNYIDQCKKGHLQNYSKSAYGTSKMMLNAWSRFILRKQLKQNQIVVCMSPGHCKTDMGRQHATRTSLQGAQTIYHHIKGNFSSNKFYHVGKQFNFLSCG